MRSPTGGRSTYKGRRATGRIPALIGAAARTAWRNKGRLRGGSHIAANLMHRFRSKFGGSRTRTMTKVKQQYKKPEELPSGLKTDRVFIKLGRKQKIYNHTGHYRLVQQGAGIVKSASAGTQSVDTIIGHCTRSQFNTATGSGATLLQFPYDFFDLCPNRKISGSSYYTAGTNAASVRLHVRNVDVELMLRNFTSAPEQVAVYWILAKKGLTATPEVDWLTQVTQQALAPEPAAIKATEVAGAQVNATPGYANSTLYGEVPTGLEAWRRNFRVLKRKMYYLAASEVQKISYTIAYNRTFNLAQFQNQAATDVAVVGATVYVMLISKGVPVSVGVAPAAAITCTTAATEVGYTASVAYHITALESQNVDTNYIHPNLVSTMATASPIQIDLEGDELAINYL